MNNKGQALVEFVLILPVLIFILLVVIDFGIIFNEKNKLENNSIDIINLYNNGRTLEDIEKIYKNNMIEVVDYEEYYKIVISKKVKINTPGLKKIMGNPHVIEVERIIPYA